MQLSEVPLYEITGADNEHIILKNGDKTTKRKFDDKTLNTNNKKYLLTEHGFMLLMYDLIWFKNQSYKAGLLHVVADRVTHFTFNKFIMCIKKQQHTTSNYDEVKGNWLIKNSDNYMKVRHLGCCWRCSTNNEIIIDKQDIKCYDDNSIHIGPNIINFTDNKLTVHNNLSLPYYETMLKLSDIPRHKIISFTKDNVVTSISNYDRQLFKDINFTSEYIRTIKGFTEIANNKLIFGEKEILLDDIVYIGKANCKVLHIFTKDKKYCCRTNKLYSSSHRIVDNPYLPWSLTKSDGFISHLKLCKECDTNSDLYIKADKVVNFNDEQIIIEYDSKTSVITLVAIPEGFKLVQQPYESTKTTETQTKPVETQKNKHTKECSKPQDLKEIKYVVECLYKGIISIINNDFYLVHDDARCNDIGRFRIQNILTELGLFTRPENKSKVEKEIAIVINYLSTENIKIIDGKVYLSSRDDYDLLPTPNRINMILTQLGWLAE